MKQLKAGKEEFIDGEIEMNGCVAYLYCAAVSLVLSSIGRRRGPEEIK